MIGKYGRLLCDESYRVANGCGTSSLLLSEMSRLTCLTRIGPSQMRDWGTIKDPDAKNKMTHEGADRGYPTGIRERIDLPLVDDLVCRTGFA